MTGASYRTHVRPRMGTLLAVTVREVPGISTARWTRAVFALAARWEGVLGRHDRRSPVSGLNRAAGRGTVVASRELALAMRQARALARQTQGCFDPTAAPLLDAWRRAAARGVAPRARTLQSLRARVGWPSIRVRGGTVSLERPGMRVDLGAIGKGLALDRIARRLGRHGPSALLNFGESSLRPVGPPPPGGWPVVLRHPRGGFAGEIRLRSGGCSTSAIGGQSLVVGGRRWSHIVDPRSGWPLAGWAQVTVVAPSAAAAEALSTALLVAGRPALPGLTAALGAEACWIDASGIATTPGLALRRS